MSQRKYEQDWLIPKDYFIVKPKKESDKKKAELLGKFIHWFIREKQKASKFN